MRHRIDLVVVSARRKGRAFFNEVVHPRCGLGQVHVMRFDFTGNGVGPCLFAPIRLDGDDAGDLVLQGFDDRRSVRFIFDEFPMGGSRTEFFWKRDIQLDCKALRLKAKQTD